MICSELRHDCLLELWGEELVRATKNGFANTYHPCSQNYQVHRKSQRRHFWLRRDFRGTTPRIDTSPSEAIFTLKATCKYPYYHKWRREYFSSRTPKSTRYTRSIPEAIFDSGNYLMEHTPKPQNVPAKLFRYGRLPAGIPSAIFGFAGTSRKPHQN